MEKDDKDLSRMETTSDLIDSRTAPIVSADRWLLQAEAIARRAHDGQTEESTGDPYIRHVERVVGLVEGEDAKCVAWLHDVIEDSNIGMWDLLDLGVSPRIVRAVVVLTHSFALGYEEYISAVLRSADPLAIAVKRADLEDHLRPNCPERLRGRYVKALRRFEVQRAQTG